MKNILQELYNGRIYPAEIIISKQPEYSSLNEKLSDSTKAWKKKLPSEDYVLFEALLDLKEEICCLEVFSAFSYGFKLGALVMLEVMGGMEELMKKDDADK